MACARASERQNQNQAGRSATQYCESQAMRLRLYQDAQAKDPGPGVDEPALDPVLAGSGVESLGQLVDIKLTVLRRLVERAVYICRSPATSIPACAQTAPRRVVR